MTLGQRLKELRTASGLTLDNAALSADTSRTQIVAYEANRRANNPRWQTLLRLAKAYHVTLEEMMKGVTE